MKLLKSFLVSSALFLSLVCGAKGLYYEVINVPSQYSNNLTRVFVVPGGYIWGGTDDGLVRMDHYDFTHFSADGTPGSIPGNFVRNIGTDAKNNFWVTTDKGLALYNIDSDDFTTMHIEENGQSHNVITFSGYLVGDKLLIGGVNRLYTYNYDTQEIEVHKEINAVPAFNVDEIYPLSEQKLLLFDHIQGFLEYDYSDNSVSRHETALEIRGSYCYFMDSHKRFWRSVYNKGIECFDMQGNLLATYTTENSDLSTNLVSCFCERQGKIFAGTLTGGINIIDPQTKKITFIRKEVGNANDFPANAITSLFCDHNDNIWAVREKGGVVVIRESFCRSYYISPTADPSGPISLNVVDISSSGASDNIWLGTASEGIFYLNRKGTNSFGRINRAYSTSDYGILAMTSLPRNRMLVACLATGLFILDKDDMSFKPAHFADKSIDEYLKSGHYPISMCHDDDGNIIIITDNFYKVDASTEKLSLIKFGIGSDHQKIISSNGKSLNYFNNRRFIYRWFPNDNTLNTIFDAGDDVINSTAVDVAGNIWLACDNGLFKLEPGKTVPEKIDNQLFNSVQSINYDRYGRIWLGTSKHMFVYFPETDAFVKLDINDGIRQNNYSPSVSLITKDGSLIFGGTEGISVVDLGITFDEEVKAPEISLMSLLYNDQHISDLSKTRFSQDGFNRIVVKIFVSEDDILQSKSYRFRVVGSNGYDVTITGDVPYTNIREHASGRYTVYASCTMRNGEWCDWQEVVKYRIIPQWYRNPLFIIPIILLLIALIMLIYRLRLRNREGNTRLKFLLNVSHELKTPLTLIIGPLSRVLKETPSDDKRFAPLSSAYRQAQRMKTLILTVLDANKIEEGSATLYAEPVDYNDWVARIAEDFREELSSKNITLNIVLDKAINETDIDSSKLENVLTNILINAVKHTPEGGEITVGTILQSDGMVRTYVDDTGEGLDNVDTTKLFDRYYQGITEKTGSGMGLAYANTIVKIHKGKMGAKNNDRGGARFFFDIPKRILGAILALFMLTVGIEDACAQSSILSLSPSDGYPSDIWTICVDNFGCAYLGSDAGVCRVSGDNFTYLNTTDSVNEALSSNNVRKIERDRAGNIWLLTDGGLFGFKPQSLDYAKRRIEGVDSSVRVFSAISLDDAIYFGGTNTIWQYSYSSGKFSLFTTFETDTPFDITSIASCNGKIILASSGSEKPRILYPLTGQVETASIIDRGHINALISDSRGWLWLSRIGEGISCVDENFNEKSFFSTKNSNLSSNLVTCLYEINGRIWAGTYGGGINIITPETREVTVMHESAGTRNIIPNNFINTITSDSRGNIWVGTSHNGTFVLLQHGVSFYDFHTILPEIPTGGVNMILTTNDGSLWVGFSGAGLAQIDATGKVIHYPSTNGLNIFDITSANDELIFSCFPEGFYSFNKKTGICKELFPDRWKHKTNKFQGAGPSICGIDDDRKIIIADSIYVWYYLTDKKLESYPLPKEAENHRLHIVDGSSMYFVGGNNLFIWDDFSTDKLYKKLSFEGIGNIQDASCGENSDIWMVCDQGLVRYNTQSDSLSFFDLNLDSSPQCLMYQKGPKIWIGTRKSLYIYYCNTGQLIHISKALGAPNNKYEASCGTLDEDRNFYMGGRDGIVRVSESAALNSIRPPEFVLDAVLIDDNYQTDIKSLVAKPSYHTIELKFIVKDVDVLRPKKCRFFVDGPDSDEIVTEIPVIKFNSHLQPGRYSIRGQIESLDGTWTEPQELVSFKVKQVWYLRWWAVVIYAMLFALLLFLGAENIMRRRSSKKDIENNKERYNFLIDVSHELRTPLTLIRGPIGRVLDNRNLPKEEIPRLETIQRQAERMNDLLDTVLTAEKIEKGAAVLEKQPVPVNRWISEQTANYKDEALSHDMSIILDLDKTIGEIEMDESLCRIVLFNMMTNAIKHNAPGSPITIKTQNFPTFNKIRVNISDNGSGLANIDSSKIFEEFYKGTEEKTGLGIGLYYSKKIVEEHNGHIGAYNNTGDRGATFWFDLPYGSAGNANAQTREDAADHSGQDAAKAANLKLGKLVVLCVDDDKDMRAYLTDELSACFKAVLVASNGKEALKILSTEKVDLVISDIMMPEMDGLTLCREIKTNPAFQTIPVCLLTAKADEDSRNEGISKGADAYLTKPFDTFELAAAVEKIIINDK